MTGSSSPKVENRKMCGDRKKKNIDKQNKGENPRNLFLI